MESMKVLCKVFKSATRLCEDVASIHSSSATKAFVPREEIVVTRGEQLVDKVEGHVSTKKGVWSEFSAEPILWFTGAS
jgi:hypothetical protein